MSRYAEDMNMVGKDGPIAAVSVAASVPVTFDGTVGLFSPARAPGKPAAILFASPWGLEEMCSRKFFRVLADQLAENGFASLRFDYAGTGDSLADDAEVAGLDTWLDNLVAATNRLKHLSGCDRIVIVAQGIGATIAMQAMPRIVGCEALAFLAPVVSGRAYLREMQAMARMIDNKLGMAAPATEEAAVRVAGLSLSAGLAADLRTVDLMKVETISARSAIVFARDERPSDAAFAQHLHQLGLHVEEAPFDGYAKLTTNPTMAEVPLAVIAKFSDWLAGLYPQPLKSPAPSPPDPASHETEGFAEELVRFGENDRLYGIFCGPPQQTQTRGVVVLFLSAGYDRMSGWGRTTVKLARALAREGITSLRFDCANVADSPPVSDAAVQVLYSAVQLDDVSAAIDWLRRRLPEAGLLVTGRCSGAYLTLQSACRDERIAAIVAVNPVVYEWPAGHSVEDALENPAQSMDHYAGTFWRAATLQKLLRGEIEIGRKFRQISIALGRRMLRPLAWLLEGITARERIVFAGFRHLDRRKVISHFVYSADDVGLEEFRHFFGAEGQRLKRFTRMSHAVIDGADHNFTPAHARQAYLFAIMNAAALTETPGDDASG